MATQRTFPTTANTLLPSPLPAEASNNTTTARWPLPGNTTAWTPNAVWEASLLSLKIGSSLETILILSSNVALLLLIVTSPALRRQMRYRLVLSLVAANLTVGLFSAPFLAEFTVRRKWVHSCYFRMVCTLLTAFVQNFVSMWGVVLLLLHYLARVTRYEGPAGLMVRLPAWLSKALPGLIVASPWLVAVLLQIPLVFLGLHEYTWVMWHTSHCPLVVQPWMLDLIACDSYFIPAVILVVLVVIIIVHFRYTDAPSSTGEMLHHAEMGASLVSADKTDRESWTVHVVAAVLTVLLMGPENVYYGLMLFTVTPMAAWLITRVTIILLGELLPFLLAVVWMLMLPELRERLLALTRLRRSPPPSSPAAATGAASVGPVSFRDLRDE